MDGACATARHHRRSGDALLRGVAAVRLLVMLHLMWVGMILAGGVGEGHCVGGRAVTSVDDRSFDV